jgi:methyltransferase (TIGR00027 family)
MICVDVEGIPEWVGLNREFQDTILDVAVNPHSGLFFLTQQQMRYAADRISLHRRDRFIGDYIRSAYANLHAPFLVWRAKSDPHAHHVVHADNWLRVVKAAAQSPVDVLDADTLRMRLQQATIEADALWARLTAIEASTIWRATKPFRIIGTWVPATTRRRLRQMAKAGYRMMRPRKIPASIAVIHGRDQMPNLSNSLSIARLRYIQSVYEPSELRNPDTLVKYFIPLTSAGDQAQLGVERRAHLRNPFYYYLVARTKYYDEVFLDAIFRDIQQIINVGSGTDTRAYRFAHVLKRKGVRVIDCDQSEAIYAKQRLAEKLGRFDHIEYLPLDLNEDQNVEFERRLVGTQAKSLVLMEGVSPYVHDSAFGRFLLLLANKLPAGSRIVYDFKLCGIDDDFGRVGRTRTPFRLPKGSEEIAAFHAQHGHRLEHLELSSELSTRLLPNLVERGTPLFSEDGLVELTAGI